MSKQRENPVGMDPTVHAFETCWANYITLGVSFYFILDDMKTHMPSKSLFGSMPAYMTPHTNIVYQVIPRNFLCKIEFRMFESTAHPKHALWLHLDRLMLTKISQKISKRNGFLSLLHSFSTFKGHRSRILSRNHYPLAAFKTLWF